MNYSIKLISMLTLCFLLRGDFPANPVNNAEDLNEEEMAVTIALTKFDVNDTILELRYKIKNNTDHDVWICDCVSTETRWPWNFEVYLAEDAKTLVIRKRLDILPEVIWAAPPELGRYVRLQPSQEYTDSFSRALPVRPVCLYKAERADAEFASRLVIEIGFYNEDVLERIRSIIELAERFHCASAEFSFTDLQSDIMRRYFKGLLIEWWFGGLSHFDEVSELRTGATYQLIGEQVLQISVDGVHIPYEGYIVECSWSDEDEQSQQRNSTNKEKSQ